MRRTAAWIGVALLALAGCSGSSGSAPPRLVLTVAPTAALFDSTVTITVTGAHAGSAVTLATSSVDRDKVPWSATATFRANSAGVVSTAQAPVSGSYRGVNPMGLFQDEAPRGDAKTEAGFYGQQGALHITVTAAVGGHVRASTTISRLYATQLGVTVTAVRTGGLYGTYSKPKDTSVRRPALLVLGGSEGGDSGAFRSQLLAAHGYPALSLAYFHAPGRPDTLHLIPIEYFATALRWLANQPGVDPHRLVVWGVSRGSEAALLTGAHYPGLVAGVVATSPSDIAYGGIPIGGESAWSFGGRPVPFALGSDFLSTVPTNRDALIPIESIAGPILAVCGVDDILWPSCGHVDSIEQRLIDDQSRYRPTLLKYPGAGHFIGSLLPQIPDTYSNGTDANGDHFGVGGTPAADEAGKAAGWALLLKWLSALPAKP